MKSEPELITDLEEEVPVDISTFIFYEKVPSKGIRYVSEKMPNRKICWETNTVTYCIRRHRNAD